MVHAAVHDAVQAIERRYEPYHVEIPGASGSRIAATAKAAHDVLVELFPAQTALLDADYQAYLLANGIPATDPGVAVGQQAAAGIIALRANDGRPACLGCPSTEVGGTDPGVWRPTPPAFATFGVLWMADVQPFTFEHGDKFRADGPPPLGSSRYAKDYNEVKALGPLVGSTRTPEQTDIAHFYADATPILWNRALRALATARLHKIGETARLFALANLANADAIITAWDAKRHFMFWRPVTAIQEGDNDFNGRTTGDPAWLPLIVTPNYPDYTSGANSASGSMTRSMALFFGRDKLTFSVTSLHPLAVKKERIYTRFSAAAEDVVNARIYSGIHFRFADTAARRQAELVAEWVFKRFLRPVRDHHDDDDDDDDDHDDDDGHGRP